MTGEQIVLVLGAALLLLLAHAVRAFRWSLLFPRGRAETDQRGLLISLGLGYAVNAIVPLRLGEIVRSAFAARLRNARFAEVMATVVAERLSDLLLVTAFVLGLSLASGDRSLPAIAAVYALVFGGFAAFAVVLRRSAPLRRLLWAAVGIFNTRIRLGIADFTWSTAEILVGGTIVRWQFSVATAIMWSAYFASYAAFAAAIDRPVLDVIQSLLLSPFSTLGAGSANPLTATPALQLFVLAPVAIIILTLLVSEGRFSRSRRFALRGPGPHFASRTRYRNLTGYDDFLDALFTNSRHSISAFGTRAVDDCVVHGFFHGGSDALTALVETPDQMLIRKFGLGTAALKLKDQADWLRRHGSDEVPLVTVVNPRSGAGAYRYDMPLWQRTSPFHETIHSTPLGNSRKLLLRVLDRIDRLHASAPRDLASRPQLIEYCTRKASDNAARIIAFGRSAIGSDHYRLNGVDYHVDEWLAFNDEAWLGAQLCDRRQAVVHGDVTVENVVVAPEHEHGFYLIDPNPENIFDSPLIDWAKMMQSLHLGYETLNRTAHASVREGEIVLPLARSEAYASLHRLLESEITSRFSGDALREVYFHELVNYLRLTPYKIRQSPERGLAFFACTSILLRKYRQCYA